MFEDAGPEDAAPVVVEVIVCIDLEGESTEEEVERGSLRGVADPAIPAPPAEVLEVDCSIERLDPRALAEEEAGATVVDWTGAAL